MYFVNQYEILKFLEDEHEHEEFIDFKTISDSQIDLNQAILIECNNGTKEYRMDIMLHKLQELKSPIGCSFRFRRLFKVAKIILVTPNSNAGIERVYSIVNKNKSENSDRKRLDVNRSLSSILAVKLYRPESDHKCYDFHPDE